MYEKFKDIKEENALNLTETEKLIKQLGVENGERAKYVWTQIEDFETKEEKNTYIKNLHDKKVISNKVMDQIKEIKEQGGLDEGDDMGPKEEYLENRTKGELVKDYLNAFKTDPSNAMKAFFTREKLGIVEGNLVELQRFFDVEYYEEGGSEEKKREMMEDMGLEWSERGKYKLEHILPVSAGGGNKEKNLKVVPNDEHYSYTPVDVAMGLALKEGRLTRKEAKKLATEMKVDQTKTPEQVLEEIAS